MTIKESFNFAGSPTTFGVPAMQDNIAETNALLVDRLQGAGASIRNPAHYCGVFGHKPTFGIVPTHGQSLPGVYNKSDITVVGPLARSAEDLALSLDITAGPNKFGAAAWRLQLPKPRKTALKDFRVSVMLSDPVAEVEQSYQDNLLDIADALRRLGATVSDTARPDIDTAQAMELYTVMLRAATSRPSGGGDVARLWLIPSCGDEAGA